MLISSVTFPIVNSRQVGENNGENNGENVVLNLIKSDPKITQPQIAVRTGFSERKVSRLIAALKNKGKIVRVGKTKGGYWKF